MVHGVFDPQYQGYREKFLMRSYLTNHDTEFDSKIEIIIETQIGMRRQMSWMRMLVICPCRKFMLRRGWSICFVKKSGMFRSGAGQSLIKHAACPAVQLVFLGQTIHIHKQSIGSLDKKAIFRILPLHAWAQSYWWHLLSSHALCSSSQNEPPLTAPHIKS